MAGSELTGRIAATLGAILVVTVAVALTIVTFLEPWLDPVFGAAGITSTPAQYAVGTAICLLVLLLVQLRYARRELLSEADADPADPDGHGPLLDRVTRLAAQLDMTVPSIAIADTDVPNSFAVGGVRSGTIVVSEGLLERLESDELDGVIAHELVHLKNRDAAVMTLASFLPALVADEHVVFGDLLPSWTQPYVYAALLGVSYVLASAFIDAPLVSFAGLFQFLVALGVTVVLGGIVLGILASVVVFLSRGLSRQREFVADRDGATLTGNPAALASALERLDDVVTAPREDARQVAGTSATSSLPSYRGLDGMCLLPHGFDRPGQESNDDGDFHVETHAHPPTDERIAQLGNLAAELETMVG
ncbi:M48 family metalloprotease [Natronosalvus vescus]|uniref:M48 family metalloprotease n=1 Tax=Natronosalvus vescus TaxID=2953881 RepID=UPI0020915B35|nr:M48 family metalloprotease [Natronosalvus vescus]